MNSIDVERSLVEWIGVNVHVPVSAEVPKPRPPSFVTVERTGGQRAGVIDNPVVAIQCWGRTRYDAAKLAYEVDGLLSAFAYEPGVHKVERVSLYNFPDEKGGEGRYQIVANIKTIN